ncbi:hypothetical protein NE237_015158 [Protea cynaroides]|uniref:RRM domain-containing protein n=1 Tax=Protea cynaroides TaxID=273540 RepID=A0A9Q0QQS1_9MAGN|nr:hypothetical protein NE237_015158 [Protea cynaroides]
MLSCAVGSNILQLQKKLKVLQVQIQSIESFLFVAWPGTPLQGPCVLHSKCMEKSEGAVILDKTTGKSRGYGFITYKHMESTQSALKEPSKLIDWLWLCYIQNSGGCKEGHR